MQLSCIIAERTIHLSSSNRWAEFWPEPMKCLVDMLNNAHWLRNIDIYNKTTICFTNQYIVLSYWTILIPIELLNPHITTKKKQTNKQTNIWKLDLGQQTAFHQQLSQYMKTSPKKYKDDYKCKSSAVVKCLTSSGQTLWSKQWPYVAKKHLFFINIYHHIYYICFIGFIKICLLLRVWTIETSTISCHYIIIFLKIYSTPTVLKIP